jgi:hypothetical protein
VAILYVHVVAMELHLVHFPDRLVHTTGYCAEELWWLWLKLISATTDLLGCTSGVLSPYNLKLTASKPQSNVLDTVICNQIVQQRKSKEYFQIFFSPTEINFVVSSKQHCIPSQESEDLAFFLSLFFLSHD